MADLKLFLDIEINMKACNINHDSRCFIKICGLFLKKFGTIVGKMSAQDERSFNNDLYLISTHIAAFH